jgi:hypothetical protein
MPDAQSALMQGNPPGRQGEVVRSPPAGINRENYILRGKLHTQRNRILPAPKDAKRPPAGRRRVVGLRRAAIHEAGHAVANLVLKQQFGAARIFETPQLSFDGIMCAGEVTYDTSIICPAVCIAIAALAGPIADARARKRSIIGEYLGGGCTDFENAKAALVDSRFDFAYAERQAQQLVRRHWAAITAVAAALVAHRTVGRGAVAMIAAQASLTGATTIAAAA